MKPYSPDYIQKEGYLAQEQEKELRRAIGNKLYEVLALYESAIKNKEKIRWKKKNQYRI